MNAIAARIEAYERLMRLHRPIGILLLLWPTLWALWLARRGVPPFGVFLIFFTGTVLMRSGGCAVNDFADRNFDSRVERTRDRPLATGAIRPWEALAVGAACAAVAFALVLFLNTLTIALSFGALVVAMVYPFLKRFFWLPQAWLGIAFGFGIPMAFAALTESLPPLAWAMLAANILWTIAYDTEYAMVDRDDDMTLGLKTSAILFGRHDVAAVMACYAAFLAIMAGIGIWQDYGPAYYVGLALAAAICAWHYTLIRGRTREGCFRAFLGNNWVGAAIFLAIVADNNPLAGFPMWIPQMILVVHAHPYPHRSRACAALLEGIAGLQPMEVRSLYDLYPDFDVDVASEQAAMERAKLVVWLHPIYWYTVPGLLKHWFDVVLLGGWAHGPGGSALEGKDCLWVPTTGDLEKYAADAPHAHRFEAFVPVVEQTARYCGMKWLDPFVLHDSHTLDDEHLKRAGRKLHGRLELWLAEHRRDD